MEYAVARDSELIVGSCTAVTAGGFEIVLFKHEDGSITALEDRCSHADVALSAGSFENGQVECAAHGARFDARTGRNLCMPAVTPVKTFPVTVTNGEVFVTVQE